MKIRTRALNPGETFCCRISSFKKYFSKTTLRGHFADLGREYAVFLNSFEDTYLKKNVKGYVIASTTMCCLYDEPAVCFYAIPKQYFDEKKKEEFERSFFPIIMDIYQKTRTESQYDPMVTFLVEYLEGNMIPHVYREK